MRGLSIGGAACAHEPTAVSTPSRTLVGSYGVIGAATYQWMWGSVRASLTCISAALGALAVLSLVASLSLEPMTPLQAWEGGRQFYQSAALSAVCFVCILITSPHVRTLWSSLDPFSPTTRPMDLLAVYWR